MSDKSLKDKAISIKGKDYVLVSDRVLYFNDNYKNGAIEPSYTLDGDTYHFKAIVTPDVEKPLRRFVGHSKATIGDGMVNKSAAMENAETSAVGRALAMMGIGVIESIASADEMNKATSTGQRTKFATEKQIDWIRKVASRISGYDEAEDIDKWVKEILTVEPKHVPIGKVKDAVDKLEGVGKELTRKEQEKAEEDVEITDEDIEAVKNGDIPY